MIPILVFFLAFNDISEAASSQKMSLCLELFTPVSNTIRLAPKKPSRVPRYYVGNLPKRYKIASDLQRIEFSNRIVSISESSPVTVMVRRQVQKNYEVHYETVDASGNYIYFLSDIHSINSRVYFREYQDTVFFEMDKKRNQNDPFRKLDLKDVEKQLRTFSPKKIKPASLEKIASDLADTQNVGSSNEDFGRKTQKNLASANQFILSLLKEGKDLAGADVSAVNRRIEKGLVNLELETNVTSDEEALFFELSTGIVRGTTEVVKHENKLYRVDLTSIQASAENYFNYVPAHLVAERLQDWINRINKVDQNTTLTEIAELYKEFAAIHPFRAGVGRTARVLISYALLRAGFKIEVDHRLPAEAIHTSIGDLAQDLARALLYPYPQSQLPIRGSIENGVVRWRAREE